MTGDRVDNPPQEDSKAPEASHHDAESYFACSEQRQARGQTRRAACHTAPARARRASRPRCVPRLPVIRRTPASSPPESPLSPRAKREASSTSFRSLYKKGTQCSMKRGFFGEGDFGRNKNRVEFVPVLLTP